MKHVVLAMILFMLVNWKGLLLENAILDSEKIKTSLYLFARFSLFYLCRAALGMTARTELYDISIQSSVHRTVKFRFGKIFIALSFSLFFYCAFFLSCGGIQHFNTFKENSFHLFIQIFARCNTILCKLIFKNHFLINMKCICQNWHGALPILSFMLVLLISAQEKLN